MIKQLLTGGLMMVISQLFAQSTFMIQDAVDKKMVSCTVSGSWNTYDKQEFLDADGQYFGKCMTLNIRSKVDSIVWIYIINGLMLMCEDTATQNMIITKPVYVQLQPKETKTVQLYAMCSEIHDAMPHKQKSYAVGNMADDKLVSIAQSIDHMFMHNIVGQGAVWAYTDNATEQDLRKYGATDHSLAMTIQVLNNAGVITNINPTENTLDIDSTIVEIETKTLPWHDENFIPINPYLFYSGCAAILFLSGTTIYLLIRRRKNYLNTSQNV